MFRFIATTMLVALMVLSACGTPTDNATAGRTAAPVATAATNSDAYQTAGPAATTGSVAGAPSAGPAAAGNQPKQYAAAPKMQIDPNKSYTAVIDTTKGKLTAELYPKDAPLTVNNFVFLARDGFYRNIKFHRILKDFMNQTGDPLGTGQGGPGYSFKDEPVTRDYTRGTLAMANSGPNTNGSQFFIMNQDAPQLPKSYTIFGKVTSGLDTLDAIANTPVTMSPGGVDSQPSSPTEDVRIKDITITEK